MLAAPAREGEVVSPGRALQVVGDLDVDGPEPGLQLLGLVRLELVGIAPVATSQKLSHRDVRPAVRTLTRSEDMPRRAAHLEHLVFRSRDLQTGTGRAHVLGCPAISVPLDVDKEFDRLYGVPPEAFVDERRRIERELREEDRRVEADEVKALAKPTTAAWIVNQLAREKKGDVDRLLAAGERLRTAQRAAVAGKGTSKFDEAREEEAEARRGLTDAAASLLEEQGRKASRQMLDQVDQTLRVAAVLDEGRELLAGVTPGRSDRTEAASPRTAGRKQRLEQARGDVREARSRARETSEALRRAEREATKARRALDAAEAAAEKARREADEAAAALERAESELSSTRNR